MQGRRATLSSRLTAAEAELTRALDARRELLVAGDLADEVALATVDQKLSAAERSRDGLVEAVTLVDPRIDAANARLAEFRDAAERGEIAAQVRGEVDALKGVLEQFRDASARLTSAIEPLMRRIGSAADFLARTHLLLTDIAAASDNLAQDGSAYAVQIESGHRPIMHDPVPQPEPEPVPEAIEREQIFTLQHVKWKEGEQIVMAAKFTWAKPPKHLATLACERDLADLPGSPRTEKMIATFGVASGPTSSDLCVDLDSLDRPPAAEQPPRTLPPWFEERIGEARQVLVDAGRV
jgi:hypothetical protein